MISHHDLWNQLVAASGRTLDEAQIARLEQFLDLLSDANMRMNLTRLIDRDQAAIGHVGDALTLLPFIPANTLRLADVGSGGGVPGLPLAIVLPKTTVYLIEATQKKAVFLQETVTKLELTNVKVLPMRAEEAGQTELRGTFGVVTARAIGDLSMLVEWCLPLVAKAGRLLAMKGQRAQEELLTATKPIHILCGGDPIIHPVALPGTEHHVIIEIPKIGATEKRYPRPASIAKGKPIH